MQKLALLIGISEYELGLRPLPGAVKDVEALQHVLQHPDMGGFHQVKTLTNPDLVTMQGEIEALFADREKDDLILLFFSGHGLKDNDYGKFYFATTETRKTTRGDVSLATTVPASFVHSVMDSSRSRQQVIILDCCFSGAFAIGMTAKNDGSIDIQSQLGGEGRAVLTSSTSTQYSFEQSNTDLSVYTCHIVEGIETGAADINGDGRISVDELHQYAKQRVQAVSPTMKPEMYPVREGSQITLAAAPVLEIKLIYRRQLERLASQGEISDKGKLSRPSRVMLNALREALNLSQKEAVVIEAEVLKPYRDYRKKLQRFQHLLHNASQAKTSASNTRSVLERLQKVWNLRPEDVERLASQSIKQRSRWNIMLRALLMTGTALAAGTTIGLSWQLYRHLPLPTPIYASLDGLHESLENQITDLRFQLADQLLGSQPDSIHQTIKQAIVAEQHADELAKQPSADWHAISVQWEQASLQWQIVIDLVQQLPSTASDRPVVTHYLKYLNDEQQQAQAESTFAKARELAKQASDLTQNTKSLEKWKAIVDLWQKAAGQMLKVPSTSTKYQAARSKVGEYVRNKRYTQLKAKQKLKVANTHHDRN